MTILYSESSLDIILNFRIFQNMLEIRKWANVMKAMSDETRLKILSILIASEMYVGEIAEKVGISPSVASRHLKLLENAGLVERVKIGNKVLYKAARHQIESMLKEMMDYLHGLGIS